MRELQLNAISAEQNLKNSFVEKWQDLFACFSTGLGFTLSLCDKTGTPLISAPDANGFCAACPNAGQLADVRSSSCRATIRKTIGSGTAEVFKCAARLVCFSLPVDYLKERGAIFGRGSFEQYEDFRDLINEISRSGRPSAPLSMPRVFTTPREAQSALDIVRESVNGLLHNTLETFTLRRKFESLKSVMTSWTDAAGRQPDVLFRDVLDRLSTLLDIDCIAILTPDKQRATYTGRYALSRNGSQTEAISINADEAPVRELLTGQPFVLSAAPVTDPEADFLQGRGALYFFPVLVSKKLEAILRIEDRALDRHDIEIVSAFCKQAALIMENQRLREDVCSKIDKFSAITELTHALTPIQNDKAMLQVILDKSADLLKAEQGSLMLLDNEADVLLVEAKKGIVDSAFSETIRISRGEGIAGRVAELGEAFLVENVEQDPRIKQKNRDHYKTRSFVSVPLKVGDRIIGVLNLADKDGGEVFTEEDLKLMESIAAQAAILVERNLFYNRNEELKKLSVTDELTRLPNRRYLHQRLEDELARSERHGHNFSLLMLDLDGFKTCNDHRGHEAGDKLLITIADILLKAVRSMDIVTRYGGDEFLILLPETENAVAIDIAERVRRAVSKTTAPGACPITASIGVANYPGQGKTSEQLIKNADRALYAAKHKGKNCIGAFS